MQGIEVCCFVGLLSRLTFNMAACSMDLGSRSQRLGRHKSTAQSDGSL